MISFFGTGALSMDPKSCAQKAFLMAGIEKRKEGNQTWLPPLQTDEKTAKLFLG